MTGSYWKFCDVVERTAVPGPAITAPARTERVVLEQHTATGEYRLRPLETVVEEAVEER